MLIMSELEQLNYIHRFAGIIIVLLSNIHGFGYSMSYDRVLVKANVPVVYLWTFQGIFTAKIDDPANRMALIALISLDVLCFFSTSFWRRKAYNVFFVTHMICFVLFLPTVSSPTWVRCRH